MKRGIETVTEYDLDEGDYDRERHQHPQYDSAARVRTES